MAHPFEALYVEVPVTSHSRDRWHRFAAPSETLTRMVVEMCDSSKQACDLAAAKLGVDAGTRFSEARARGVIAES